VSGFGRGGGGGGAITIEEVDGTPSVVATVIKYPNNSLTVVGTTVSVDEYPAPLGVNGANLATFAPYLRAGYTFNDASGSLTDSVGVPHDMAAAGASGTYLQAGKNGTAIKFNATTYFKRPPQGFSPGSSEFTLNWWVNTTSVSAIQRLLYWTEEGTSSRVGVYIGYNQLRYQENTGTTTIGATAPLANTWQMVTYQRVRDGGSYYNRVFLNGAQEINVLAGLNDFEKRTLYLGRDYSSGYAPNLTGDELLYYTGPDGFGAISPAAILELYNSGTGVFLDTVGTPTGLGFSHADLVGYNSYLHDYWKFEEAGTPLIDAISNNSLAGVGNPTYAVAGKSNNCIELDDAGDYLTRTGTFLHKQDQEFTISLWVNPSNIAAATDYLLGMNSGGSRLEIVQDASTLMLQHTVIGNISSPTIINGTWNHLVISKKTGGLGFIMSYYVNGTSAGSLNAAVGSFLDASVGDFHIGATNFSPGSFSIAGKVDELAYWKGIGLDSAAVTALYNSSAGRFLESI
jgi:hypothetical protein